MDPDSAFDSFDDDHVFLVDDGRESSIDLGESDRLARLARARQDDAVDPRLTCVPLSRLLAMEAHLADALARQGAAIPVVAQRGGRSKARPVVWLAVVLGQNDEVQASAVEAASEAAIEGWARERGGLLTCALREDDLAETIAAMRSRQCRGV